MIAIAGIDIQRLTRVQRKLLQTLSDGSAHTREELLKTCLSDDLGDLSNVNVAICQLRKRLPAGYLIVYVSLGHWRKGFQLVRHIRDVSGE